MENDTECSQAWNFTLCWIDRETSSSVNSNHSVNLNEASEEEVLRPSDKHDWQSIREELQWAFSLHIYGFACLFFMLAFYTFFSILNLRSQISNHPFMSTINIFLCVLGVTRAACFLIEPYTSGQVIPGFLGSFMWDVGYPCILSAFSLIQLAFSQLTQVKFRPESLRRKSALSLLITTHFALIFGSDIATAFESHLQVVRWVVQSIFLSLGLVLCITFLYGGAHIMKLLRTIPNGAIHEGQNTPPNNKGILQLALLAQCNNIASSVLTTAAPSPNTPKIKITDEYDYTYSYVSEGGGHRLSTQLQPPCNPGTSSMGNTTGCIAEVKEESDIVPSTSSTEMITVNTKKENHCIEQQQTKHHQKPQQQQQQIHKEQSPASTPKSETNNSPRTDIKLECVQVDRSPTPEEKVSSHKPPVRKCIEEKLGDIIIKVEEADSNQDLTANEEIAIFNKVISKSQEIGIDCEILINEHEKRMKAREHKRVKKSDSLKVKRGLYNIHSVKSLDSLLFTDSALEKSSINSDGTRRGSYTEGVTNNRKDHYVTLSEEKFTTSSLKVDNNGDIIPKRKKSLTWSEDTQTIQSSNKELSSSRKSGINEHCDRCVRDNHRKSSISSRRNSHTTSSERSRNGRSNEFGELGVTRGGSLGAGGRRRSSTVSTCSNRKGSEQFQTIPIPYKKEHRSLSASSACSSRRNSSRKNTLRDEDEAESLLGRSPGCGQPDVTLASILNHIAYVNQTASASKWPMALKDSRKAQVQQVLIVTYVTAALGTVLSLALVYRMYGHFSSGVAFPPHPPWLWFTYESGCRFLEFLMGCAMANITRQPVPNRHPQYPHSLHRLKHRNSLYI